jgi:very-long-chain enoyl-CoA reductase
MKLNIVKRNGKEMFAGGLDVPDDATTDDLKAVFAKAAKKHQTRQRFTLPIPAGADPKKVRGTPLDAGKSLSKDYGLKDGSVVVFKDLGPQVPYAVVFLAEYAGPMLCYLPFYFFRSAIYASTKKYPATAPMLQVQTLAMVFHTAHYLKRILETLFVHHFSHATMPIFNLYRNCAYYWGFAAIMSYFINHPAYTPVSETQMKVGFAFSALMQLGNLHCHVYQASLRKDGSKEYKEPKGGLFSFVTCANYCCEIYQWVGFNVATQSAMGWLFVACGAAQMMDWANAKHKRLKRLFPGFRRPFKLLPPFY